VRARLLTVSEAGGQGLHVMVCLQDLSQARKRWGEDAADGFLSLFQTKVVLNGITDPKTLEAISLCLGEYDRQLVTHTLGRSETEPEFFDAPKPTETESVAYHTNRQRVLSPGRSHSCRPGGRCTCKGRVGSSFARRPGTGRCLGSGSLPSRRVVPASTMMGRCCRQLRMLWIVSHVEGADR